MKKTYHLLSTATNNLSTSFYFLNGKSQGSESANITDFIGKPVIFLIKFEKVGAVCEIVNIEEIKSLSATFGVNNFSFTRVLISNGPSRQPKSIPLNPGKDPILPIKLIGLSKGDNLSLRNRFLLEEIYRE